MLWKDKQDFKESVKDVLKISNGKVKVLDWSKLREKIIDELVWNAVFNSEDDLKLYFQNLLRELAQEFGIKFSSIYGLYSAMGRKEVGGFTVPAMNLRGLTYMMARSVFKAVNELNVGAFILEIARSEIGYTEQPPSEYSAVISGAAIKEGFKGHLFIQGDHFQVKKKNYDKDKDGEISAIKELIEKALNAKFYNIDIDASTMVDLSKPDLDSQQKMNYELTAMFTEFIRKNEPENITVTVGGEIGEVGGKNSTVEELQAFMNGYLKSLKKKGNYAGLSKVSVQTGTKHGGVVLPDGSIAKVKIDFETLKELSQVAKEQYGMSGAVQHGASTLPPEAFDKFPKTGCSEIHLATQFQNIIYDHPKFPEELKNDIYKFLKENFKNEWKPEQTEQQFLYKTRKKAMGPFKKQLWSIDKNVLNEISDKLYEMFSFLFRKLNVVNTKDIVDKYVD